MRKAAEAYAEFFGPPSSPPITCLLKPKTTKVTSEQEMKTPTENARSPGGVSYYLPLLS